MPNLSRSEDSEIDAITAISKALATLEDSDARRRVLSYVLARYLPELPLTPIETTTKTAPTSLVPGTPLPVSPHTQHELAGVARLTENGELRLTARDLKAKSGLDAAVRLAHVAVYAHEKLTGQSLSSAKGLTPLLKE
jgi:hypothetical protein